MRAVAKLLLLVSMPILSLEAQVLSSKGTADMAFGPATCGTPAGLGKNKQPIPACIAPSGAELATLTERAEINAIERYFATAGEASLANFERVRDTVVAHLNTYVLGTVELTRTVDTTGRRAAMTLRADLNGARLDLLVQSATKVGAKAGAEKSIVGLFVMARQRASVERFAPEITRSKTVNASGNLQTASDSGRLAVEKDSVRGGTVALNDRVSSTASSSASLDAAATTTSKGSATQRADRETYTVSPAEDLNGELGGLLAKSGFETVEAAFIEDDSKPALLDVVRADFGTGDDLSASTLRRLAKAAQDSKVQFIVVGTVELGLPSRDEVSGNQRVYAKVSAKVIDVSSRLPRTVVAVEPAQYAGLGPDAAVARTNAMRTAAEAIGKEVISRLNAREVR